MRIITKSKRLYLREFVLEDAIHFFKMNLDEDVIKYTGDVAFKSEAEAALFLSKYREYKLYKMGRWAVCDKKNHAFLGWCGLKYHPEEDFVEVGYRFYRKYWGNGYATESSKAVIFYGFNTLNIKTIYARVVIQNLASQRVIEKCGLQFITTQKHHGMPSKLYKIENENIQIKRITPEDTHRVRHPVLRAGRPIEDCVFDGDHLETTLHLGLFLNKKLIGVATFLKNNHSCFKDEFQFQLRGMALLKEAQKKGFGNLLLKEGESLLIKENAQRLWFNAREIAISFYKKNAYQIVGESFKIPKVGLHYLMTKKIDQS